MQRLSPPRCRHASALLAFWTCRDAALLCCQCMVRCLHADCWSMKRPWHPLCSVLPARLMLHGFADTVPPHSASPCQLLWHTCLPAVQPAQQEAPKAGGEAHASSQACSEHVGVAHITAQIRQPSRSPACRWCTQGSLQPHLLYVKLRAPAWLCASPVGSAGAAAGRRPARTPSTSTTATW